MCSGTVLSLRHHPPSPPPRSVSIPKHILVLGLIYRVRPLSYKTGTDERCSAPGSSPYPSLKVSILTYAMVLRALLAVHGRARSRASFDHFAPPTGTIYAVPATTAAMWGPVQRLCMPRWSALCSVLAVRLTPLSPFTALMPLCIYCESSRATLLRSTGMDRRYREPPTPSLNPRTQR